MDRVHEAVADAGVGSVVRLERAGAGRRNDAWFVRTADGAEVVVRFLKDDAKREMEVAVIGLAARHGLPVGEVLWSEGGDRPVMIQRRLPGVRLSDVATVPDGLCADVAATMRSIHRIAIPHGFGNLTAELNGSMATLSGWFVDPLVADVADAPPDGEDARLLRRAIDVLGDAGDLLDRQRPALAHGDLQPDNLLVTAGRVSGLIDWEAAKSGPPALDFGWWDWCSSRWPTPWPTDALLDHYDPDHDLDRTELTELRRLVVCRVWARELAWALANGQDERAAVARAGLRV
jgi:aminoglycoside phosphotransferase (APT) family kinase protein